VAGYDYGFRTSAAQADSVDVGGHRYLFRLDEERGTVVMLRSGEPLAEIPLVPIVERGLEYRLTHAGTSSIPQDVFHVALDNEHVALSVYLTSVRVTDRRTENPEATEGDRYRIDSYRADFYWSEKAGTP